MHEDLENFVKKYHKDLFTAGLPHQEELKEDVECSLPIRAAPFGLWTAPKTFLELLRPDWVVPPEGKCGAAGTTSASDQSAGLPNPEGCFTMAMAQDQIGQSASGDV